MRLGSVGGAWLRARAVDAVLRWLAGACWWGATAVNAVLSAGAPGARRRRGNARVTGGGGAGGGGGGGEVQADQGEWAEDECLTCRRGEETVARWGVRQTAAEGDSGGGGGGAYSRLLEV